MPKVLREIRTRLIHDWISGRTTIDGQIDGFEAIVSATQSVLGTMIGLVATRAVLSRAVAEAAQRNTHVEQIRVVDDGLDLTAFRSQRIKLSPASSAAVLSLVVDELIIVLFRLLGGVTATILREVEGERANSSAFSPRDRLAE
jgi:hypothetical protein